MKTREPSAANYRHADDALLRVELEIRDRQYRRELVKTIARQTALWLGRLVVLGFAIIGILEVFG